MTLSRGGRFGLLTAAADIANPVGPDGPPSSVNWQFHGDGKWYIHWTNYDPSYQTQLSGTDGETVERTLAAGVTEYGGWATKETGRNVRHISGGVTSDWAGSEV